MPPRRPRVSNPRELVPTRPGMDQMTTMLWLLALRIAVREPIVLALDTWPVDYRPSARA